MKPSLVPGTRDLAPVDVFKRNFIFDTIRKTFAQFGFQPLETPAMEKLETLTGKYGDEGDQLLFKIRSNKNLFETPEGNKWVQAVQDELEAWTGNKYTFLPHNSDKGLRYDLTVPFARFVVMNQSKLAFPFKRYQIQAVWRGERTQKGRYSEFFQCDCDAIGSPSLLYEAELCQIYDLVFAELGLKVVIKINNRKILEGLAHFCGAPDKFMQITVAIDKLDKIGWDGVQKELQKLDIDEAGFQKIKQVLECTQLSDLEVLFANVEIGKKGIEELKMVNQFLSNYTFQNTFELDFSLARGLSYYTGCIFEVVTDIAAKGQENVKMGSIGGGGRYDNLTGIFGLANMSGVGISFGADRIFDVLEELNLFDVSKFPSTKVLILSLDAESLVYGFQCAQTLRQEGISTDIYPEPKKFQKQMEYANKRGVPYIIVIGESERNTGSLSVKNMITGTKQELDIQSIINNHNAGKELNYKRRSIIEDLE